MTDDDDERRPTDPVVIGQNAVIFDGSHPKFCTKHGPSRSQILFGSFLMSEINQSVFVLRELKENSGRSGTCKLALLQALLLTTALRSKGNSCVARHVTPQHFFSIAHRFEAAARNMFQRPPDNRFKAPLATDVLMTRQRI